MDQLGPSLKGNCFFRVFPPELGLPGTLGGRFVRDPIDMSGDLPSHDCANKTHEAFRLSQFTTLNRLHNDHKCIVNPLVDFIRAKLMDKVEAHAAGEQIV